MAKVERRGEMWTTRISLTDPTTGQRTMPRVTARTKRELDQQVAALRAAHTAGTWVAPSTITLGQVATEWLENVTGRESKQLVYETIVSLHILPDRISQSRVMRLDVLDIEDFRDRKLRDGVAPSYVVTMLMVLSMVCDRAVKRKLLPANPVSHVRRPKRTKPRPKSLTTEEVQRLFAAVEHDRMRAYWYICALLGLRRGEALALRWDDVDLAGGWLVIERTYTRVKRDGKWRWVIGDAAKSDDSIRRIQLPLSCQAALARHQREQERRREQAGPAWIDDGMIFDRGDGARITSPNMIDYFYRKIRQRVGLPEWSVPHTLRHTAATHMIWRGVPITTVSRILGHSDATTTMRTYAHVLEAMESHAATIIDTMYETVSTQIVPSPVSDSLILASD